MVLQVRRFYLCKDKQIILIYNDVKRRTRKHSFLQVRHKFFEILKSEPSTKSQHFKKRLLPNLRILQMSNIHSNQLL